LRFIENRCSLKGTRFIVVSVLGLTGLLNLSATARAEAVVVRVVPRFDPAGYAGRGAVGLMVPEVGGTVTRAGALAALERGKVRHALLGGVPTGRVRILPSSRPGRRVTVYVVLPPPGRTPNHTRYPVAVVGCGFHGLLTSSATRVRGLISIADVAPAVVRLRKGGCDASPLGWHASRHAPSQLASLDRRIHRVAKAQGWVLVAVLIAGGVLALLGGGSGVAAGVGFVAASLILSAFDVQAFWPLILGVVGIASVFALTFRKRRLVPVLVAAFYVAFLAVLVADPSLSSLGVLGAHLEGGGRFYGVTNQLETLLLAPTLAAAAADGASWLVAFGVLVLVTVGWSRAGADGGGIVVYAAALAVLAVRMRGLALTPRRALAVAAGVVVVALAAVGLDAALGGSSHVTHAVGTGPGSVLGDIGRRLHLSYLTVTSSSGKGAEFAVGLAVLVAIGAFARRGPILQAFLVGIAVSFLVNDSPVDVAFLGALGCWMLARWESVDSRAMRRSPVVLFASALLVLAAAGCGSQGTVQPTAQAVIGTIPKAVASGKQIFAAQGCAACHTFKAAGAKGVIGPDLDKLPKYAKQAHQPLKKFVTTSIVHPGVYIQPGYTNLMPKTYATLPPDQLTALANFLITKH
jgi:cytochrome c551/c552